MDELKDELGKFDELKDELGKLDELNDAFGGRVVKLDDDLGSWMS